MIQKDKGEVFNGRKMSVSQPDLSGKLFRESSSNQENGTVLTSSGNW